MKRHRAEMRIGKGETSFPPGLGGGQNRVGRVSGFHLMGVIEENPDSGGKARPQACGTLVAIRDSSRFLRSIGICYALLDNRYTSARNRCPEDVSPRLILFGNQTRR